MKRLLTKQWSFFWAGVGFGIAQIIFMTAGYLFAMEQGKPLESNPITVTTNLGGMFHGMEVFWWGGKTFGLEKGLYGSAFKVDTWGPILGMILGGFLVALAERESRAWVRYRPRALLTALLGGFIFSYGTRLADGCTLNHLLGGIPLISIKASIVLIFMMIGGLVTFFLMSKFGMARYFKHQETLSYVKLAKERGLEDDSFTYDPKYNPWKDPWRWIGIGFMVMFLVPAVVNFFSPASRHSIPNSGLTFMLLTLLAGVVAGISMAKSGFGTECAVVSVEASQLLKKREGMFARFGLPRITRTLFKGLLPLQGVLAALAITGVFAVGAWVLFDIPLGFQRPFKNQLDVASIIGGLLLGAGSVMLIGCEIRSYMRVGLGYTNTLFGFIGFALGYLPYTLFYEAHKNFQESTRLIEQFTWGQLLLPGDITGQKIFALLWTALLVVGLIWAVRVGARNLSRRPVELINQSTEDLELALQQQAPLAPNAPKDLKIAGAASD